MQLMLRIHLISVWRFQALKTALSLKGICKSLFALNRMSRIISRGRAVRQRCGKKMVVENVPMPPLESQELDWVYSLPYMRTYHPSYEVLGGVPGIEEVEFSITHNRGCFGACNFCSIQFHQGRYITARSKESIVEEAKKLTTLNHFKGYIHDIGGPTANFEKPSCEFQLEHGLCKGKKCLAPNPCPNLVSNHDEYLDILREVRKLPRVKKCLSKRNKI